jgi:hypothetical protein
MSCRLWGVKHILDKIIVVGYRIIPIIAKQLFFSI